MLTGGGPGTKSQTTPIYMYQQAFKFYNLGYGTAMALVLLVIGALFSLVYMQFVRVDEPMTAISITGPRIEAGEAPGTALLLIVIVLAFLAPMLWLILGSLHSDSALTVNFGGPYTFDNFRKVMNASTLWTPLRNSLILVRWHHDHHRHRARRWPPTRSRGTSCASASCSCTRSCSRPACRSPRSWCRSTRCSRTST